MIWLLRLAEALQDLYHAWDRWPRRRALARWWLDRTWKYRRFEVVFSRDGSLCYVCYGRPRCWMGVAKRTGPHPQGGTFSGGMTIKKRDGEEYWREIFDFTFYEVKSGARKRLRGADDLVADYLTIEGA